MSLSQWMLPVRAGVQHATGRQPRVPDRASTALACQLSRVAGSAAWLARVGPHGQQCDCLVHQPARLSMIMSHVTTHPPSPPLESNLAQVAACHPQPGGALSCSHRALTTAHVTRRMVTPFRDDSALLQSIQGSSVKPGFLP